MIELDSRSLQSLENKQSIKKVHYKRIKTGTYVENMGISSYYRELDKMAEQLQEKYPQKDKSTLITLLEDCNANMSAAETLLAQEMNESVPSCNRLSNDVSQ